MITKSLTLKNMGRHRSLTFNSDGNVVGLMGENGSGKSTILEMLRFAMTGETADTLESYVTLGENAGSVEWVFQKDGKEGRLTRTVGKTSRRTLDWEGQIYKKAEDVERCLEAIFGADRRTVSSAIFIRQGNLMDLLFDTQAKREQLFGKLMNLSYLEAAEKAVTKHIEALKAVVTDLSVPIANLESKCAGLEAEIKTAQEELSKQPDHSADVTLVQRLVDNNQRLLALNNERSAAQTELAALLAQLTQAEQLAGYTLPTLRERLEVQTARQDELDKLLQTAQDRIAKLLPAKAAAEAWATAKTRYGELALLCGGNQTDKSADLAKLEAELTRLNRANTANKKTSDLKFELKMVQESLDEISKSPAPVLEPLMNEIQATELVLDQTRRTLNFQANVAQRLKRIDPAKLTCPDCGLKVLADQQIDPEQMQKLQTAIEQMDAQVKLRRSELVDRQNLLTLQNAKRTSLTTTVNLLTRQIAELEDKVDATATPTAEAAMRVAWEMLAKQVGEDKQRREELALLQRQEAGHIASVKAAGISTDSGPSVALSQIGEELAQLQQKVLLLRHDADQVRQSAAQTSQTIRALTDKQQAVSLQQSKLGQWTDQWNTLAEETGELEERVAMLRKEIGMSEQELSGVVLENLQQSVRSRHETVGRLTSLQKTLADDIMTLTDYRRRAEADKKRVECIQKLQEAKAQVSRHGIPGEVVRRRFAALAALTQSFLHTMNVDFSVYPDPEQPLAFRFVRGGADLSQSKLSGGQRVRLGVAFLMAVQALLVPDVGLLVLDEPSMHLDVAGKQDLAELLMTTAGRLNNTETQIWVADHAIELEPVFTSTLKLTI